MFKELKVKKEVERQILYLFDLLPDTASSGLCEAGADRFGPAARFSVVSFNTCKRERERERETKRESMRERGRGRERERERDRERER